MFSQRVNFTGVVVPAGESLPPLSIRVNDVPMDEGRKTFLVESIVFGDNGDEDYQGNADRTGNFWGLIIEPSVYLIEDKLEFVARYAYQGSEEDEGIRTNSRYFRGGDPLDGADINSGRGDSHHSIYAGLNYYFCDHYSKVLLGVEYDKLDTPDGDADAVTLWAAYRMYF